MNPMELAKLMQIRRRNPFVVVVRDVLKTKHRNIFAVDRLMNNARFSCIVCASYNNPRTKKRNLEIRFTTEDARDRALDFIDLHFPSFILKG
jgi:hypothetical protein